MRPSIKSPTMSWVCCPVNVAVPTADKPQGHSERQQDIARVQNEIDPVITFRALRVPEHRVVEEKGQNRQRAVEASFDCGPPISVSEDQPDIPEGSHVDLFFLQQNAVIERKPRVKRV